ncbi:Hint domain-containing protein [Actinomycetes bacterium KLBMP 9797]
MPIQLQAVILGGAIALVGAALGALITHLLHMRRIKDERRYAESRERKDWVVDELRASIQNEDDAKLIADLLRRGAVIMQPSKDLDSPPERISRKDVAFGCVPAGTMVTMSDGTFRPVQDVKKGDLIKAFDPDTHEASDEPVEHVVAGTSRSLVVINGVFEVTKSQHVLASGHYQQADQLSLHHDLSDATDPRPVFSLEYRMMAESIPVFCIVLESGGGYYVRPDGADYSIVIREGDTGKTGLLPFKLTEGFNTARLLGIRVLDEPRVED